jgi:hypothetical protein
VLTRDTDVLHHTLELPEVLFLPLYKAVA